LKKEKKVGAKVGKKGVSYTTNLLLRRKPFSGTQATESGNPHFFSPRNSFCRKIFAAKVGNRKKVWTESFSVVLFPV